MSEKKSKVYFTKEITPESLVRIYEAVGLPLTGKVAIKLSTGEAGNTNYLKSVLIEKLVKKLGGKIVECNTAYQGARNGTQEHLETAKQHGFAEIAEVDIMDAEGEMEIPVKNGKHLEVDIVGKNFADYDSMLNLAHFKGHPMGGFGGAIKNQSIGIASAVGKTYIHTAGKSRDLEKFLHAFDSPANMKEVLAPQMDFLESMAESAKAVADYMAEQQRPVVYINVINNLSVDCDCSANPEAPCMADIGIAGSLDPVALDQACIDLIWQSDDPGKKHFQKRVERQQGLEILPYAEQIGLGLRDYELVELD